MDAASRGGAADFAPRRPRLPGLAPPVTYRVQFGGGAQAQFHTLPDWGRDALVERAVELSQGWEPACIRLGKEARR